jgi:hypothetical protein
VLNGAGLYLFVDTQTERTIGVLLAAFAATGLMVTLEGLRKRHPLGVDGDLGGGRLAHRGRAAHAAR